MPAEKRAIPSRIATRIVDAVLRRKHNGSTNGGAKEPSFTLLGLDAAMRIAPEFTEPPAQELRFGADLEQVQRQAVLDAAAMMHLPIENGTGGPLVLPGQDFRVKVHDASEAYRFGTLMALRMNELRARAVWRHPARFN